MKYRSKRIYGWLLMASMLLPILAACGAPAELGHTRLLHPRRERRRLLHNLPLAASEAAAVGRRQRRRRPPRPEAAASEAAAPAADGDVPESTLSGKVLRSAARARPPIYLDPQASSFTSGDHDPGPGIRGPHAPG